MICCVKPADLLRPGLNCNFNFVIAVHKPGTKVFGEGKVAAMIYNDTFRVNKWLLGLKTPNHGHACQLTTSIKRILHVVGYWAIEASRWRILCFCNIVITTIFLFLYTYSVTKPTDFNLRVLERNIYKSNNRLHPFNALPF